MPPMYTTAPSKDHKIFSRGVRWEIGCLSTKGFWNFNIFPWLTHDKKMSFWKKSQEDYQENMDQRHFIKEGIYFTKVKLKRLFQIFLLQTLLFRVKFYIESKFQVENKCFIIQMLKLKDFVSFGKRSSLVHQANFPCKEFKNKHLYW